MEAVTSDTFCHQPSRPSHLHHRDIIHFGIAIQDAVPAHVLRHNGMIATPTCDFSLMSRRSCKSFSASEPRTGVHAYNPLVLLKRDTLGMSDGFGRRWLSIAYASCDGQECLGVGPGPYGKQLTRQQGHPNDQGILVTTPKDTPSCRLQLRHTRFALRLRTSSLPSSVLTLQRRWHEPRIQEVLSSAVSSE